MTEHPPPPGTVDPPVPVPRRVPRRMRADAPALAAAHGPVEAPARWLHRYTEFLAAKRGLATALHSGDPAFDALPAHFTGRLGPTLGGLLDAAIAEGAIRADIGPRYLLRAVANPCLPVVDEGVVYSRRRVGLLVDGLRYGAPDPTIPDPTIPDPTTSDRA